MKAENFKICNQQAVDQRKPMVSSSPIPRPKLEKINVSAQRLSGRKGRTFLSNAFLWSTFTVTVKLKGKESICLIPCHHTHTLSPTLSTSLARMVYIFFFLNQGFTYSDQ